MKHKGTLISLLSIVLGMLCLAYSSVPLYNIFCKVTGYGGTVRHGYGNLQVTPGHKTYEVRFNADMSPDLPWKFKPESKIVTVRTGVSKLVFYTAENLTDSPTRGIAVYNVTPHKVGKYFNKIACFCFAEQTLAPYQKSFMPVSFFIDPGIENDPEAQDVESLTLSYTFFKYED